MSWKLSWLGDIARVLLNVSLIFLVGALAMIAIWGLVIATVEDPCNLYLLQMASDQQKNVVFSCGEFWLNRYQSLLGNVLTAAIAFVTLMSLFRQLSASNRESAVTAAQGLRVRLPELARELHTYNTARTTVRNRLAEGSIFSDNPLRSPVAGTHSFADAFYSVYMHGRGLSEVCATLELEGLSEDRTETVSRADKIARSLISELGPTFGAGVPAAVSRMQPQILNGELDEPAGQRLIARTREQLVQLNVLLEAAETKVIEEQGRTWRQIRAFEAMAVRPG